MSTRRDWRSEIFNAIAAGVVALLIWVYANERTRETDTVTGTVRFAPSDPRELYTEPTSTITVSLEVRGSRTSIERVGDALKNGVSLTTGSAGIPAEPGTHNVQLVNALALDAAIASTGAEITSATPETVRIEVGKLVTDQVPVTPVLPRASIQGDFIIDPPVVAVTMPATARNSVAALTLDAIVDTKNLEPGRSHSVDVDLKLPESLNRWKELSRIVPPRAKVTFTLLATTAEYSLSSVPVEVALPPSALDMYSVSMPAGASAVQNVIVTGPLASIDRLRSGEFLPAAVLSLSPRTLAPGVRKLPISFWRMPEGVTVVSAAGVKAGPRGEVALELNVDITARAPR